MIGRLDRQPTTIKHFCYMYGVYTFIKIYYFDITDTSISFNCINESNFTSIIVFYAYLIIHPTRSSKRIPFIDPAQPSVLLWCVQHDNTYLDGNLYVLQFAVVFTLITLNNTINGLQQCLHRKVGGSKDGDYKLIQRNPTS